MEKTLDDLLEEWQVDAPGIWKNETGPIDWWGISNNEGIIAYFGNENDAFGFRLYKINQILNGTNKKEIMENNLMDLLEEIRDE